MKMSLFLFIEYYGVVCQIPATFIEHPDYGRVTTCPYGRIPIITYGSRPVPTGVFPYLRTGHDLSLPAYFHICGQVTTRPYRFLLRRESLLRESPLPDLLLFGALFHGDSKDG